MEEAEGIGKETDCVVETRFAVHTFILEFYFQIFLQNALCIPREAERNSFRIISTKLVIFAELYCLKFIPKSFVQLGSSWISRLT